VTTRSGWFAARPSRTESNYKIVAESFLDDEHLDRIAQEAQAMVGGPPGADLLTP
jgi:phosphoglucomutase